MPLIRMFKDKEEGLNELRSQDGRIYLTVDQGNLYFDIANAEVPTDKTRIRVNAQYADALRKVDSNGTSYLNFDDIALKTDMMGIQVYTEELNVDSWILDSGQYKNKISIPSLSCGYNGKIPPIISWIQNQQEYSKIRKANCEPNDGIEFVCNEKPEGDIGIVVIDYK